MTVSRATPLAVRVTEAGFGRRVVVSCPCLSVGAWALRDVAVADVIEELRQRHRQGAPLCPHRERRRPE